MKNLIRIIPIIAISLLFVGCKNSQKTAESPAIIKTTEATTASDNKVSETPTTSKTSATSETAKTTETSATSKTSQTPEMKKDDFSPLMGVVFSTKTAVTGKKFDQAEKEFKKFEAAWSKVEDGVRTKSATTYREIEDAATQVNTGIKAKDQEKTLKGLEVINKQVSTISEAKK